MKKSQYPKSIITRLLRVFFYLLYRPMAWSYDLIAAIVSWGRWQDWVLTVTHLLDGPQILELGHGPGHLQIALISEGYQVYGIDASSQMGKQARKRITKKGYKPRLINAYAQRIPFRNDSFNQIVATFPTAYIHASETLREAYRTLKPGGNLVTLPFAWITGKSLLDRGLSSLSRVTYQSPDWDPQWLFPFENAGFYTEVEMIHQSTWSLVIIKAHKPMVD